MKDKQITDAINSLMSRHPIITCILPYTHRRGFEFHVSFAFGTTEIIGSYCLEKTIEKVDNHCKELVMKLKKELGL